MSQNLCHHPLIRYKTVCHMSHPHLLCGMKYSICILWTDKWICNAVSYKIYIIYVYVRQFFWILFHTFNTLLNQTRASLENETMGIRMHNLLNWNISSSLVLNVKHLTSEFVWAWNSGRHLMPSSSYFIQFSSMVYDSYMKWKLCCLAIFWCIHYICISK